MPADDGLMSTMLMVAVMVIAFWFLLIRPAQKKQKEQATLVSGLSEGTRVMTTAGIFGTVRHLGERQIILEIAPGVEMTVLKQAILRQAEASEDEFEYDDAAPAAVDASEPFDPTVPLDPASGSTADDDGRQRPLA